MISKAQIFSCINSSGKGSFTSTDVAHYALLAFCLTSALSIVLTQISLGIYLIASVVTLVSLNNSSSLKTIISKNRDIDFSSKFFYPVVLWVITSIISAVIGINSFRAFKEVFSTVLHLLVPFFVYLSFRQSQLEPEQQFKKILRYLIALCLGFGIAAIHSIISSSIGFQIKPSPPGEVTESGQLVFIMPIITILNIIAWKQSDFFPIKTRQIMFYFSVYTMSLLLISWPTIIPSPSIRITQLVLFAVITICIVLLLKPAIQSGALKGVTFWNSFWKTPILLSILASPLLVTFIINLKRGPWFGVIVAMIVFGWFCSKRILLATMVISAVIIACLTPVQQRLFSGSEHFVMEGGRRDMWRLGFELVEHYPLGLGLDNARHMRKVDPIIPPSHRHMHNNLLNITLETGWLGLSCYIWWMFGIIWLGFHIWNKLKSEDHAFAHNISLTSLGLSCAILGWQIAGLVEYNFGDGEIRLIAFFFMGLLLAISEFATQLKQKNR